MSICWKVQKLQHIGILDDLLILRFWFYGLNLRCNVFLIPACQDALIEHGVDLPVQLANTPTDLDRFLGIKGSSLLIFYTHKQTVMGPTQFGSQCVPNWKRKVEPPHLTQVTFIKSQPKLGSQFGGNVLQHLFSISRLVILPAGFKKCLANVPVSVDHSGIDRRIDLPLCLDDIALDGPIDVL